MCDKLYIPAALLFEKNLSMDCAPEPVSIIWRRENFFVPVAIRTPDRAARIRAAVTITL